MSKIVAFCGSKGSGKNTSADFFKEFASSPVEEIAIAGHLKEACASVFAVEYKKFVDPALKEVEFEDYLVLDIRGLQKLLRAFGIDRQDYDTQIRPHVGKIIRTPRGLLQYIGTEVLHPIDPLIHVKMAMKKKDPNKITLITDLRFVAEFEYFKATHDAAFVPLYVKNSRAELAASIDGHPSERQFELFKTKCRVLDNEGSLEELRVKVKALAAEI